VPAIWREITENLLKSTGQTKNAVFSLIYRNKWFHRFLLSRCVSNGNIPQNRVDLSKEEVKNNVEYDYK
jgi:hypothetical protein